MGKSNEVKILELEDDVNEGAPKTMYMAFIRVTVENNLKNPKVIEKLGATTFTYDEKHIQAFFDRYGEDKIEYAYILHKEDTNEKGETEKAHYHICVRNINGSNFSFSTLKKDFPVGKIERGRTWEYMLQYLLHRNAPEKTQHEVSEIITNIDDGTLDMYLKSTPSVKKKNGLEYQLQKLKDDIADFKILPYEFREQTATNRLYRVLNAEYEAKIERAFNAQKIAMYERDKDNRSLKIIFIEGAGGYGKSALAVALCKYKKWSYYKASDENDPMQDYASQKCLILDDLRDSTFSFSSFMRLLDTYTGASVQSRYRNKAFLGDVIIISSYCPLSEYYKPDSNDVKSKKHVADKNYYDTDALVQLHRRIKTLIRADKDFFYVYDHKKDGSNVLKHKIANPAYLIKPEKEGSDILLDDLIGARDNFANTLIKDNKVDESDYELYIKYTDERSQSKYGEIFNADGKPIGFETYKEYCNEKTLAGGILLDEQGKPIALEEFKVSKDVDAKIETYESIEFMQERADLVTEYFERKLIEDFEGKISVLQRAIAILKQK